MVDRSFAISDYVLDSSLGRADGDVYRDLLERVQHSQLNAIPVRQGT